MVVLFVDSLIFNPLIYIGMFYCKVMEPDNSSVLDISTRRLRIYRVLNAGMSYPVGSAVPEPDLIVSVSHLYILNECKPYGLVSV